MTTVLSLKAACQSVNDRFARISFNCFLYFAVYCGFICFDADSPQFVLTTQLENTD